jgi:hypothetical protein
MSDQPKNENDPETGTAPIPDNVINVDFNREVTKWVAKKPVEDRFDVECKVFYIEEAGSIGLEFNRPVQEFKMDAEGADRLISALVACFAKVKERE